MAITQGTRYGRDGKKTVFGGRRSLRESNLARSYRAAVKDGTPERFYDDFETALEKRDINGREFSMRRLFESFIDGGREIVESWSPASGGGGENLSLLEASGSVDTSAFSNVSGQIVYNEILGGFKSEEFVFTPVFKHIPTTLNGEKIAGTTRIGDEAESIGEGQPYPQVGFGEDWIETPETTKRGMIVPLTKEVIFFDRVGQLMQRAGECGEMLGLNKEKRIIDCLVDENGGAKSAKLGGHRYHWKGTSYATYQATTPWDNVTASNALVDWTDIDAAEQTLSAINDPYTGEPIMAGPPTHLIVCRELLYAAKRIVHATDINYHVGGYATSGNLSDTRGPNPVANYTILSSQLLDRQLATNTTWYIGRPQDAFCYMENWPVTVVQAPSNSHDEFHRDVVMQWKASERGAPATKEPRLMGECTA